MYVLTSSREGVGEVRQDRDFFGNSRQNKEYWGKLTFLGKVINKDFFFEYRPMLPRLPLISISAPEYQLQLSRVTLVSPWI